MTKTDVPIAIFAPSMGGGGAERVVLTLANGLARLGLTVDLVLMRAEGPLLTRIDPNIRIVGLNTNRARYSMAALVRYLRRRRPAAMLSTSAQANMLAIFARRIARVPTRLIVRENTTPSLSAKEADSVVGRAMPRLRCWLYPLADTILAPSHGVADDLSRMVPAGAGKIRIVYNPTPTADIRRQSEANADHPWFKPGQHPVILAVGRLTPAKDHRTLLRAFAILRAERGARLFILGEGGERTALTKLVEQLGLENDVALPGFAENPYPYMARAAQFVLSSVREGLPNALIEAMACGCPVVSTDCRSGPKEILDGGRFGPLVPTGDPAALADAITATLDAPPPSHLLKERAEQFSADRILREYAALLLDE